MPLTLLSASGGGVTLNAPMSPQSSTLTFPQGSGNILSDGSMSIMNNKTLNSGVLTGTLTAGGSVGTDGQVLTSTAIGVQWGTVSLAGGGTGATTAGGARTNLGLDSASNVSFASVTDSKGNLRDLPINARSGSYTLVVADAGKVVSITTGGVTVPSGILAIGNAVSIWNNSGSTQTITQGSGITLYNASSGATGNRSLAGRGLATIICVDSNIFVISGSGLS